MNKHDLITKIKQLDGLTQDERATLIELVNTKKKYGLVWEDKPEDVEEQLRTQLPVLCEVAEKRILGKELPREIKVAETKQPDLFSSDENQANQVNPENQGSDNGLLSSVEAPNHILIEGDNLHALTALTFTHEGRIDVIYIDPPYNTGNKDFKYNDSFVDREDSYRHSKWLSFMDKRLRIAKRLLSEKGVIFISIDDNEQAQLKMICDEVYSSENVIANIIWKRRVSSNMADHNLSGDHEYILVIKKPEFKGFKGIKKDYKSYKNPDKDPRGDYVLGDLTVGMNKDLRPNQYYDLIDPRTNRIFKPNPSRVWAYIPESMNKLIKENRVYFPADHDKRPMIKRYKSELGSDFNVATTLINTYDFIGTNSEATRQLQDILHKNFAIYPKPISVIKFLIEQSSEQQSTILDFFAGSGTTLHATMQLNAEHGGNRQCILVTNNENNICEEVTYERNKRVIQGYTNSKGQWVNGLSNNNLRYYRSEFVGREPSLKNKRQLTQLATELLCIKEDCYEEQAVEGIKNIRYFSERDKHFLVVYDDTAIESAVEFIKKLVASQNIQENGIKVYVFSPGQYPFTEEFEEVLPFITICALPDAIYKAYMNVLPKRTRQSAPVLEDEEEENNQPNLFE